MTASALQPTYLLDEETYIERAQTVAVITEALRMDPVWKEDGDTGRRRAAKRIGFARWRVAMGELTDAAITDPEREIQSRAGVGVPQGLRDE